MLFDGKSSKKNDKFLAIPNFLGRYVTRNISWPEVWHLTEGWSIISHTATQLRVSPRELWVQPRPWGAYCRDRPSSLDKYVPSPNRAFWNQWHSGQHQNMSLSRNHHFATQIFSGFTVNSQTYTYFGYLLVRYSPNIGYNFSNMFPHLKCFVNFYGVAKI